MNKKTCKIETLRSVVLYIYIVIRFQVNSLLVFFGVFGVYRPTRKFFTTLACHLRGPVTLTPITERLAVELSLPIFKT